MYFALERVRKITEELKTYIYSEELRIKNFNMKDGNYVTLDEVEKSSNPWKKYNCEELWGGRDIHSWFRTTIEVSESMDGKTIAFCLLTEGKGFDAVNPQFLFYVNGELMQGLDINHREVIITENAQVGEKYDIDLHAYSGMLDEKTILSGKIVNINKKVSELYYDIKVPLLVCEELDEDDKRRVDMLLILNQTINLVDLRNPFSDLFYESVEKANNYIREELYEKMCGHNEVLATCVGHTHIDVAWLWTVAQTREKVVRSFSTVLNLMKEYPEFRFMSSQPQLYEFVRKRNPEVYEKIKEKIKEGVWEAEGAMWLEADCNVTSGESLVRQILFGTKFFKEEFNVENKVLWLPDVFGYSAALPQILIKSDIRYFMTNKISWSQFNRFPYDTFMWRGIDGTEVLTYFTTTKDLHEDAKPYFTTYNGKINPESIIGGWDRYHHKEINNNILIPFGYGDGGGGATKEMLEIGRRMSRGIPACPKVKMGTAKEFFEELEKKVIGKKQLPKWVGELYLEYHRGTYTSMGRNKKYNRKSEFMYQEAEFYSTFAKELGREYPKEQLNKGWKTILLNQFHDILPGSSIKEVYEVSEQEYIEVLNNGKNIINSAQKSIASKINLEKTSLVVFNTLSHMRNDIVEFEVPETIKYPYILDEDDKVIDYQFVEGENCKRKVIFFAKNVPSKGYKVFRLEDKYMELKNTLIIRKDLLENQFFNIKFDSSGNISSLYDKVNSREILKEGETGNNLLAFEDKPIINDNWDIDIYYQEKMWKLDDIESINVIENGPIRGGIEIKRKFSNSFIIQKVYIYKDIPRIDFDTYIDWKESQVLLKAAFPVDIHTDKATYEIQFGNVERPTHWNTSWDTARFEVCAHKWADLSEDDYGVSLINDCKYGYDIKDGVMRLTLIKSGIEPNKDADKEEHKFSYSIYPHEGNWRKANTIKMAYNFNVPMNVNIENAHCGNLPTKFSFVNLNKDNVILETVKKAEDSEEIILRMYECYNRRTNINVSLWKNIESVVECNLMERYIKNINFYENNFCFDIKPYEIKTFKLKFKDI